MVVVGKYGGKSQEECRERVPGLAAANVGGVLSQSLNDKRWREKKKKMRVFYIWKSLLLDAHLFNKLPVYK